MACILYSVTSKQDCGDQKDFVRQTLINNQASPVVSMVSLLLAIPADILSNKVAPFLDTLALVRLDSATLSKRHRSTVLDTVLRGTVLEEPCDYDEEVMCWLVQRGVHVANITFHSDTEPSDLTNAIPVLSKLETVVLDKCTKLTSESVQKLLQSCGSKSLSSVSAEGCAWLNDETLKVLADHHSTTLKLFTLDSNPSVTDAGAAYVLSKCLSVSEVKISDCPLIGALAVPALANHTITSLHIEGPTTATDSLLADFVQGNKDNLVRVFFEGCGMLIDATLLAIAQHCPSLKKFNVSYCNQYYDCSLSAVIKTCQQLTSLRMDYANVTYEVLECLAAHVSTNLITLYISGCEGVTVPHITALVKRTPLLEELNIGGDQCHGLDDEIFKIIGANLPNLAGLCLNRCVNMTHKGLSALLRGCPEIDTLNIVAHSYPHFNDKCLSEIGKHCSNLQTLFMYGPSEISDKAFVALAKSNAGQSLEKLTLTHSVISDKALQNFIKNCPVLEEMDLIGRGPSSPALLRIAEEYHVALVLGDIRY